MWPFDRDKRARIEAELVEAQAAVVGALNENAPAGELRRLSRTLGTLALKAGDRITHGTWGVVRRARDTADTREQDALAARSEAVLDQLRACTGCKGRDFFVSHALTIGELMSKDASARSPTMRLAVCANCGKTTIWTVNLDEVRESGHFSHTTVRAKGGDGGPFRDE
jgi:hypothetical protein